MNSSGLNFTIFSIVIIAIVALVFFLNQNNTSSTAPSLTNYGPSPTIDNKSLLLNGNQNQSFINPQQQQAAPAQQQQMQQQPQQSVPQNSQPVATVEKAVIKTTKGDITIQLFSNDAPQTVANFANKAASGFYQDLTFHRVEDWVIQGGDPKGDGTGGGKMRTELNDHAFVKGSVGIARGSDIAVSNDAQFFITKKDASWLNKQYTNFGEVTEGMDVVEKIEIGDKILSISIE